MHSYASPQTSGVPRWQMVPTQVSRPLHALPSSQVLTGFVGSHASPITQPVPGVSAVHTCPSGQTVKVSVIDSGALYAFFRAEEFGLTGSETAADLDASSELRNSIEWVRRHIAELVSCRLQTPIEPFPLKQECFSIPIAIWIV